MVESINGPGEQQPNHEEDVDAGKSALQKNEANIDESELRTDPEDERSYTWAEFKAAKLEFFSLEELVEYWFDEMTPDFPEGTKVVVTNLSKTISDDKLTEAFSQAGELAFCQVYYDANEESKGFAKLQFVTVEAADAAVKRWDGAELGGQKILVRPLVDKGKNTRVCVGGLDPETTPATLERIFSEVGEVVDVFIPYEREAGDFRRIAKVEFLCPESVEKACSRLHLTEVQGKKVCCMPWIERAIQRTGRKVRVNGPSVMVSRMSSETSAEGLRRLFDNIAGMVVCSLRMITDRESGQARGLAHVEIGDEALVNLAVSRLHGAELAGSRIVVQSFDSEGKPPRLPTVMCRQLSASTTAAQLKDHFARFNSNGAKILFDRDTGKPRGLGIVEFHDEDSAKEASEELHGSHLDGACIQVHGPKRSVGPTVYLNGLGHDATEKAVADFFSSAGEVQSVSIFKDRDTNVPSGKGVVVFRTEEAQRKAIEKFNDAEFEGRRIQVRDGVGRSEQFTIFVAGLDSSTTTEGLSRHFAHCGEVADAIVLRRRETGESRGIGKVCFRSEEAHRKAIEEYHGSELNGRSIVVRDYDTSGKGGGRGQGLGYAVFVAGLSQETGPEKLRAFFEECGALLSVNLFRDRETGRSKGCAKVAFQEEAAARLALEEWHGAELDGATLLVREFETAGRGAGGFGRPVSGDDSRGGERLAPCALFVGGLRQEATSEDLRDLFAPFGEVVSASLLTDRATGRPRGAARVGLASEEQRARAVEALHLSEFQGRPITVQPFVQRAPQNDAVSGVVGGDRGGDGANYARAGHGGRLGKGGRGEDREGRAPAAEGGLVALVAGLGPETTEPALRAHFSDYGAVQQALILADRDSGRSRGLGRVTFHDREEMLKVIEEANGSLLDGHRISVKQLPKSGVGMGAEESEARRPQGEELRVDPEDGLAYTWGGLQRRHGRRVSQAELLDYWRFDCSPAPPGAARGLAGERAEPKTVGGATKAREETDSPMERNKKAVALDVKDWLHAVDSMWLRWMEAREEVPVDRGARSCLRGLKERFDSLDQILSVYSEHLPSGEMSLRDAFFDDCGITKIGHKRLMKKWISENAGRGATAGRTTGDRGCN